jgi:hypothetical protein
MVGKEKKRKDGKKREMKNVNESWQEWKRDDEGMSGQGWKRMAEV